MYYQLFVASVRSGYVFRAMWPETGNFCGVISCMEEEVHVGITNNYKEVSYGYK